MRKHNHAYSLWIDTAEETSTQEVQLRGNWKADKLNNATMKERGVGLLK
jgi:hypothetical protein